VPANRVRLIVVGSGSRINIYLAGTKEGSIVRPQIQIEYLSLAFNMGWLRRLLCMGGESSNSTPNRPYPGPNQAYYGRPNNPYSNAPYNTPGYNSGYANNHRRGWKQRNYGAYTPYGGDGGDYGGDFGGADGGGGGGD